MKIVISKTNYETPALFGLLVESFSNLQLYFERFRSRRFIAFSHVPRDEFSWLGAEASSFVGKRGIDKFDTSIFIIGILKSNGHGCWIRVI